MADKDMEYSNTVENYGHRGQMTEKKHKLVQKVEKQLNLTGFHRIPMDSPDSHGFPLFHVFPPIPTDSHE